MSVSYKRRSCGKERRVLPEKLFPACSKGLTRQLYEWMNPSSLLSCLLAALSLQFLSKTRLGPRQPNNACKQSTEQGHRRSKGGTLGHSCWSASRMTI